MTGAARGAWSVEHRAGRAADLHDLDPRARAGPTVWVMHAERAAVVLGSGQALDALDPSVLAESETDVVRRRSGGGAVLLAPAKVTWVDLVLPRDSRLWDEDVGRAMHWVGEAYAAALTACGVDAVVHRGPMHHSEWSKVICFAGVGPGEVLDPEGRKLVGVSQRRVRGCARFQTLAYHAAPQLGRLATLLGLPAAVGELLEATAASAVTVTPQALVEGLLEALPEP